MHRDSVPPSNLGAGRVQIEVEKREVALNIVEKSSGFGGWNLDSLIWKVAERRMLIDAVKNYAKFKCVPIETASPEMIHDSTWGIWVVGGSCGRLA